MKFKIYTDTSVFGGCYDEEFSKWSMKLIDEFKNGKNILVLSDLTLKEIEESPRHVRDIIKSIPKNYIEYALLDDEAKALAQKYILEKAVSQRYLVDAQHIAIATINKVDLLVSWNFKHIVNITKIRLYNAANLKCGYSMIEIRSPQEVI